MKTRKTWQMVLVAGARPNFMKVAPLMRELSKHKSVRTTLVHTGQHYDPNMSEVFFKELGIRRPDVNLGVGSGSQAQQTAAILVAFDRVLSERQPDLVVVVGDVNSTVACSLAAAKRGVRVAHVEAGLRSFDWSMPEEINRVVTDRLSEFLFCSEPSALENLRREGVATKRVFFVGNVMIDTLIRERKRAEQSSVLEELQLSGLKYVVATLHRPSNVDAKKNLEELMGMLQAVAKLGVEVVFPLHPRTQARIREWKISTESLRLSPPLGYLDFLKLTSHATAVLTDSGGIQEETTILGVPCLTLRENTERPVTVTHGTNRVVGLDRRKILAEVKRALHTRRKKLKPPKFWDGKAAKRIVSILIKSL